MACEFRQFLLVPPLAVAIEYPEEPQTQLVGGNRSTLPLRLRAQLCEDLLGNVARDRLACFETFDRGLTGFVRRGGSGEEVGGGGGNLQIGNHFRFGAEALRDGHDVPGRALGPAGLRVEPVPILPRPASNLGAPASCGSPARTSAHTWVVLPVPVGS